MNLAYPQIEGAVFELFSRFSFEPEIEFLSTSLLGIVNRNITFGALTHLINTLFGGRGIPIGYFDKSKLNLVPKPDEDVLWTKDHRVVAIIRCLDPLAPVEAKPVGTVENDDVGNELVHRASLSGDDFSPSESSLPAPSQFVKLPSLTPPQVANVDM